MYIELSGENLRTRALYSLCLVNLWKSGIGEFLIRYGHRRMHLQLYSGHKAMYVNFGQAMGCAAAAPGEAKKPNSTARSQSECEMH
ncbi:hypothetical protein SAMN05443252_10884 [Bacillus sp. OV322]|nr:hypothetical protein SAMN05443252_10884 [Bacillus sp. OV322]